MDPKDPQDLLKYLEFLAPYHTRHGDGKRHTRKHTRKAVVRAAAKRAKASRKRNRATP